MTKTYGFHDFFNLKCLVVVVVLLLNSHNKQPDGQLIYTHYYWADLDLLSHLPVLNAHTSTSNWQLPLLNQWNRENDPKKKISWSISTKVHVFAGPGIEPGISDFSVRLWYKARSINGLQCIERMFTGAEL